MSSLRSDAERLLSVLATTDGDDAPLTRIFRSALEANREDELELALECWFAEDERAIERRLATVASLNSANIEKAFEQKRAAATEILHLVSSPEWVRLLHSARVVVELGQLASPLEQARAVCEFDAALGSVEPDAEPLVRLLGPRQMH